MSNFEDIPFEQLCEEHLNTLCKVGRHEGRRLEFKENFKFVDGGQKKDQHEIAKDVAALANTDGGDIIYGMIESDGVAQSTVSVVSEDGVEDLKSFVQTAVRDGISPGITIRCAAIPLSFGGCAFVVRVPKSFNAPHAVRRRGDREALWYWRRGEDRAVHMEESDVRHFYANTVDMPKQIEAFRRSRIAACENSIAGPYFDKSVRVHAFFIPQATFFSNNHFSYSQLESACSELRFSDVPSYSGATPCLEGAFRHAGNVDGIWHSWCVHRNGVIEWSDAGTNYMHILNKGETRVRIVHSRYEKLIADRLGEVISTLNKLAVSGPIVFCLSLSNATGAVVCSSGRWFNPGGACPVDVIHASPVLLDSTADLSIHRLKPAFDQVMNAFGIPKSRFFKDDGCPLNDNA